jgi:hypothetical protein
VLDSLHRPPAAALGRDAIRFSEQPSLGGLAFVVELTPDKAGGGAGRAAWLDGHPRIGWDFEGSARFTLTPAAYRRVVDALDRALARYRSPETHDESLFVCTDGPEALTERVREGRVVTLAGFCPVSESEPNPNEDIAAILLGFACPDAVADEPTDSLLRRQCRSWRSRARQLLRTDG